MTPEALSPAVLSLVQHVELNKAGWWDRTVQQLLLAGLHDAGEPLTREELRTRAERLLERRLDEEYLDTMFRALFTAGLAFEFSDGRIRLSEQALTRVAEGLCAIEANTADVKRRFLAELSSRNLEIDGEVAWDRFCKNVLLPMVEELGARTYHVLSGKEVITESSPELASFLSNYSDDLRDSIGSAILTFMDPKHADVRTYILRQLNTRFVLDAAGLRPEVLENLATQQDRNRRKKGKTLLFVDTNFLFSLLELHSNPANEAAQALLELLRNISTFVEVALYVVPSTLDEARQRLGVEIDRLRGLVLTTKLARAVRAGEVSGLAEKYIQEVAKGSTRLKPEEFFGPYHDDLLSFARARGIELYNVRMEDFERSQPVIDDTLDRQEFEKKKYGERAKSYEQLLHDVALWHLARSKRPARLDSPLDAGAWVVTVDYRLLGFDRFKVRQSKLRIPLCVHPAVLIQLLQFWIPRTPDFEKALIASMRLPFFFQDFDPDAERVTVKILNVLSRYENVDRLSDATVSTVLANEALRSRLEAPASVEEQIRLVESAILEENATLQERFQREAAKRKQAEDERDTSKTALARVSDELHGRDLTIDQMQERIAVEEAERRRLEQSLQATQRELEVTRVATRFIRTTVIPTLLFSLVSGSGLAWAAVQFLDWPLRKSLPVALSLVWLFRCRATWTKDRKRPVCSLVPWHQQDTSRRDRPIAGYCYVRGR
jgi:hypothetical protein